MNHDKQRLSHILRHAIPYIAILITLFGIMLVYSLVIHHRLKIEAEQRNQARVEFCNAVIEDNISNFQKNCFLLAFNPAVSKINYYDKQSVHTNAGINDAFNIVDTIRSFVENNTLAEDLQIYYPTLDAMLCKDGPLYSYTLYNGTYSAPNSGNQRSFFTSLLDDYKEPSSQFVFDQDGTYLQATFFQSIGRSNSDNPAPDRILITKIDRAALNNMLRTQVDAGSDEVLLYVNTDLELIASNAEDPSPFLRDGIVQIDSLASENIIVSANTDLFGAKLISVQSKSGVYQMVNSVSIILAISLICATLFIVILGLFFTKRNLNAEMELLNKLQKAPADSTNDDIMLTIEKEINHLIETNKAALDEINHQRKLVHSSFLRELLFRHPSDEKSVDLLLTTYGLSLEGNHFILASARRGKNVKSNTWSDSIDEILNYGTEAVSVYWTRMDQLDVFLCNYDDPNGAASFTDFVRASLSGMVIDRDVIVASEEFDALNDVETAWAQIQEKSYLGQDIISHEVQNLSRDERGKIAQVAHNMILNEFDNSQLGLYMIAERIGVSQTLLSKQFKETYGIGVAQFINQIRIEEAKKLMLSGSDNLKVIALSVGFTSDINFIRVFKRHMSMTPGQFRSQRDSD